MICVYWYMSKSFPSDPNEWWLLIIWKNWQLVSHTPDICFFGNFWWCFRVNKTFYSYMLGNPHIMYHTKISSQCIQSRKKLYPDSKWSHVWTGLQETWDLTHRSHSPTRGCETTTPQGEREKPGLLISSLLIHALHFDVFPRTAFQPSCYW